MEANQFVLVKDYPYQYNGLDEWDKERKLLRDNLKLLMENREIIHSTPEYFHTPFHEGFFGTSFAGKINLCVGALLMLWETAGWKDKCKTCNGDVYIFNVSGGLSGHHEYKGFCISCNKNVTGRKDSMTEFINPLMDIQKKRRIKNTISILITHSQYFSFKEGLVGEATPDKIIDEGINAVSIPVLIENIKKINSDKNIPDAK